MADAYLNSSSLAYAENFLAEDEVCLHLFEASSVEAAGAVSRCAAIAYDRITGAVE